MEESSNTVVGDFFRFDCHSRRPRNQNLMVHRNHLRLRSFLLSLENTYRRLLGRRCRPSLAGWFVGSVLVVDLFLTGPRRVSEVSGDGNRSNRANL